MESTRYFTIFAVACAMLSNAFGDVEIKLGQPPYKIDSTVMGTDGWESRLPNIAVSPDSARVVAVRWNEARPAVRLQGANLKRPAIQSLNGGSKVQIAFPLAVNFSDDYLGGRHLRLWFDGINLGEIYLDQTAKGGLGYRGEGGGANFQGVLFLPRDEIKRNSFYDFVLDIDLSASTFNISIQGQKKDGSPFQYKATNVSFPPNATKNPISSISIITTKSVVCYLGDLSIKVK